MTHESLALSFEGKLPNEEVYYVFHKHWLADVKELFQMVILFVLPLVGILSLLYFYQRSEFITYVMFFFFLYLAAVPLYIFMHWIEDAFDVLVLTDQRIVNIVQEGFLSRRILAAELHQIQLATYRQHGFLDQVSNKGTVTITTAGKGDLIIESLPKPDRVTALILDFAAQHRP